MKSLKSAYLLHVIRLVISLGIILAIYSVKTYGTEASPIRVLDNISNHTTNPQ